ncbi:MAG: hypothetical protein KIT70_03855 [Anaerolineales bacterium]|nr:MAG: hypothetical protein KIT70_03855 [Anaerolineales bacterium]
MSEFIISLRLNIDNTSKNKKVLSQWAKNFGQNSERSQLIVKILSAIKIPFEGYATPRITHSLDNEYLKEFRHPELGRGENWVLDDLDLKNGSKVFVKLENQSVKGRVEIKGKASSIKIEPEGVSIPLSKDLFLCRQ